MAPRSPSLSRYLSTGTRINKRRKMRVYTDDIDFNRLMVEQRAVETGIKRGQSPCFYRGAVRFHAAGDFMDVKAAREDG